MTFCFVVVVIDICCEAIGVMAATGLDVVIGIVCAGMLAVGTLKDFIVDLSAVSFTRVTPPPFCAGTRFVNWN